MTYKFSENPITSKKYEIPSSLNDQAGINKFLDNNKGKEVIVVQGLGFVGAVMSIVCANSEEKDYAVIGIDLPNKDSYWKIASINDGNFPIVSSDPKIEIFFQNTQRNNNFYATYDTYAFKKADYIIVDINLDVQKNISTDHDLENYNVSLSGFKNAIKTIGENCKEDALILIETTVPPGSTKIAHKIITEEMNKRNIPSNNIKVGHSYERVMPGPNYIDSIQNFYRVYSGIDNKSAESVKNFLETIISTAEYPLTRLKSTNATEISKVLENSFRAMNIAFVVEWSRYAEEAGVDLFEIVDAIRLRPTHANLMYPGIGVGGYCLTKDPLLASWSRQNIFKSNDALKISEKSVSINDKMPEYAFEFLESFFDEELNGKNVILMGVSYAPDIGDTRYSPVELFFKKLKRANCNIKLYDPFINYWEEMNVSVESELKHIENGDIIIFSTGHKKYRQNNQLQQMLLNKDNLFIYDTIGVLNDQEITNLRSKHIVKVLGRGDI